jgi:hypothetical protein
MGVRVSGFAFGLAAGEGSSLAQELLSAHVVGLAHGVRCELDRAVFQDIDLNIVSSGHG